MSKLKKICSLCLALVMVFGLVSTQAYARTESDQISMEQEKRTVTLELPFNPWDKESELRALEASENALREVMTSQYTVKVELVDSLMAVPFSPGERRVVTDGEFLYIIDFEIEHEYTMDSIRTDRNILPFTASGNARVWYLPTATILGSVLMQVLGQETVIPRSILNAHLHYMGFWSSVPGSNFREAGSRHFSFRNGVVRVESAFNVSLPSGGSRGGGIGMSFDVHTIRNPNTWPA